MSEKQRTIQKSIVFEGKGIHSGKPVRLVLNPAPARSGIRFTRSDIPGCEPVQAIAENAFQEQGRQTSLGTKAWKIQTIEHLMKIYGVRYKDVLSLVIQNRSLKERICDCSSTIKAQVLYAIQTEMAITFEDIYNRRLSLVYRFCPTGQCRRYIEQVFKK